MSAMTGCFHPTQNHVRNTVLLCLLSALGLRMTSSAMSTDMLVMTGIGRVIAILSIEASACLMDVTGKLYGELVHTS